MYLASPSGVQLKGALTSIYIYISISDASEEGGASAIAHRFVSNLDKPYTSELVDRIANVNEEWSSTHARV